MDQDDKETLLENLTEVLGVLTELEQLHANIDSLMKASNLECEALSLIIKHLPENSNKCNI